MLARGGANIRLRIKPCMDHISFSSEAKLSEIFDLEIGYGGINGHINTTVSLHRDTSHLGATPLHLSCLTNDDRLVDILLRHGGVADVNSVATRLELTPLMLVIGAAARGKLERHAMISMSRLLLKAGADPLLRDALGRTAWDIFIELKGPFLIWLWAPFLAGLQVMPENVFSRETMAQFPKWCRTGLSAEEIEARGRLGIRKERCRLSCCVRTGVGT